MDAQSQPQSLDFANEMVTKLAHSGFFHVDRPVSAQQFEALSRSLGPILTEFAVKVDPNRASYVCKPGVVPFHNDDRKNQFMSWHCIEQDAFDGASLILPV